VREFYAPRLALPPISLESFAEERRVFAKNGFMDGEFLACTPCAGAKDYDSIVDCAVRERRLLSEMLSVSLMA
jgi:hypothetical protein